MVTLTLTYPDSTTFIVGGFNSLDDTNAWLTTEQAKPYWISGTTWIIV
jgi:hypothetical protein